MSKPISDFGPYVAAHTRSGSSKAWGGVRDAAAAVVVAAGGTTGPSCGCAPGYRCSHEYAHCFDVQFPHGTTIGEGPAECVVTLPNGERLVKVRRIDGTWLEVPARLGRVRAISKHAWERAAARFGVSAADVFTALEDAVAIDDGERYVDDRDDDAPPRGSWIFRSVAAGADYIVDVTTRTVVTVYPARTAAERADHLQGRRDMGSSLPGLPR